MSDLTLAKIRKMYNNDEFVSLDDVSEWIGQRKDSLKRTLANENYEFVEGEDWQILSPQNVEQKSGSGGHNHENIVVTVETFKELAMLSGTPKGKQVRRHFLTCERERHEYKERYEMFKEAHENQLLVNHRLRKQIRQKQMQAMAAETIRDYYVRVHNSELSPQQYAAMAKECKKRGVDMEYMERGLYFAQHDRPIVDDVINVARIRYEGDRLLDES